MTKVFALPLEVSDPPAFEDSFVDGKYDYKLDDQLHEKWLGELADYARDQARIRCEKRGGKKPGNLVGSIIRFPVADGAAQYMVWNHSPLELIHLPIHDAWNADEMTLRGLRLKDVRAMVDRSERLTALFASDKV